MNFFTDSNYLIRKEVLFSVKLPISVIMLKNNKHTIYEMPWNMLTNSFLFFINKNLEVKLSPNFLKQNYIFITIVFIEKHWNIIPLKL